MKDDTSYRKMFEIAKRDLKALIGMKDQKEFFSDEMFGFHSQQAIEKAVKAWLITITGHHHKIHDLQELFNLLEDQHQSIPKQFYSLINFTEFAVTFRYETLESFEDELNRDDIIKRITEFIDHVELLIQKHEDSS